VLVLNELCFWTLSIHNSFNAEHCFESWPCRKSFLVTSYTTSLNLLCSCLPGQRVFWSLDRKRGIDSLAPSFTRCDSSELFFFLEFVKDIVYCERVQIGISFKTESSKVQSVLPTKCLPIPCKKLTLYGWRYRMFYFIAI